MQECKDRSLTQFDVEQHTQLCGRQIAKQQRFIQRILGLGSSVIQLEMGKNSFDLISESNNKINWIICTYYSHLGTRQSKFLDRLVFFRNQYVLSQHVVPPSEEMFIQLKRIRNRGSEPKGHKQLFRPYRLYQFQLTLTQIWYETNLMRIELRLLPLISGSQLIVMTSHQLYRQQNERN